MSDQVQNKRIRKSQEDWETEVLGKTLDRYPERKDQFITTSSEPIKRLYTPIDLEESDYEQRSGFSGGISLHKGYPPNHASWKIMDHAHVRRFWYCRGDQRTL